MTLKIAVLGALSAVAEATARLYAEEGAAIVLAGRDAKRLGAVALDLKVRGASAVHIVAQDLAHVDGPAVETALDAWSGMLGGLDHVVLAYGGLGDQPTLEKDLAAAAQLIDVNFRSAALWCLAAANRLEAQGSGSLVVIGSVAGDRGRKSNHVYGATKAGLAVLVQGIAHRLAGSGARAVVIKPGFIDSPMTAHIPGGRGLLWAKPDAIARIIRRAADKGGPVVYAPGFWRLILLIIRAVPAAIFHKTNL
jgi:decaprenylphospho-beta-D-erythro-pentofuranosid-2-ulose 2-reductase